jgi:hypothetical protein
MPIGHYTRKVKPDSWYLNKIRACGVGKTDRDCWNWTHRCAPNGYGRVHYKGIDRGAHVLSLMMHGVDIPKGFVVMHTCDNPKCVNPSHLKVATQAENRRDCAKKGRAASGDDNGMRKHPEKSFFNTADSWRHARGEEHGMAKLTDTQCAEIRDSYKGERGELTRLAERYGVSRPHIARIVKNQARKNPS